jgi:hypothetical protein
MSVKSVDRVWSGSAFGSLLVLGILSFFVVEARRDHYSAKPGTVGTVLLPSISLWSLTRGTFGRVVQASPLPDRMNRRAWIAMDGIRSFGGPGTELSALCGLENEWESKGPFLSRSGHWLLLGTYSSMHHTFFFFLSHSTRNHE